MISRRKLLAPFFIFLACSAATPAALPDRPTGFVTDAAGVINSETRQKLEKFLSQVEQATDAEIAVATVPSLDGRDIDPVAVELFKAWGVGKKGKDNGVLFLIAPTERRARIEVGYGFEGILPDGKCGRILRELVFPAFKEGNMSQGIEQGALAIARIIADDAGVKIFNGPPPLSDDDQNAKPSALIRLIVLLIFFAFIIMSSLWRRRSFWTGGGYGGGGFGGGGFGGGGFGGFGGGSSGGGGASGGW